MTGYIANTDLGWFEFLRAQAAQDEVNCWNPSDRYLFRAVLFAVYFGSGSINVIGLGR